MADREFIGGKMTTILLIDDYFVEVDTYNHTLKKKYMGKDEKTGEKKEMEKVIGFYRNLKEVLEALVRCIPLDKTDGRIICMREYADAAENAFKRVDAWREEVDLHRSI